MSAQAACDDRFVPFKYLLVLPDGEPPDPAAFVTAVPNWSVGEEFLTGDGRRFRIVGIVPVDGDVGVFNVLW